MSHTDDIILSYLWIKEDVFVGRDVVYLRTRKLQTQTVLWHSGALMPCSCVCARAACVFCIGTVPWFSISHIITELIACGARL